MFKNLFDTKVPSAKEQKKGMFEGIFEKKPVKELEPTQKKWSDVFTQPTWEGVEMTPAMEKLKEAGFSPRQHTIVEEEMMNVRAKTKMKEMVGTEISELEEKVRLSKEEEEKIPSFKPFGISALAMRTPAQAEKAQETRNLEIARDKYKTFLDQIDTDPQFLLEVKRGFQDTIKEPEKLVPFLGSAGNLGEAIYAIELSKKPEKEWTDFDKSLIEKYQAKNLPVKGSVGYGVGSIIASMPTYIAEWGALKSLVAEPVSKIATKGITKLIGEKAMISLPKVVQKTWQLPAKISVSDALGKSIGIVAHGFSNPIEISERTAEYLIPNYEKLTSPIYTKMYGQLEEKVSFEKALKMAIGTTAVDYITEYAGVFVENPMSLLGKATFGKWITKIGLTKAPAGLERLARQVGWNGIIGEVFEEELAETFQAPIEEREYHGINTPEGLERLLTETLGIGAFGGIGGISATVLQKIEKKDIKPEIPIIKPKMFEGLFKKEVVKPIIKPTPKITPSEQKPISKQLIPEKRAITPEQITIAKRFSKKYVENDITSIQFIKNIKKTFPNINQVVLEDIADKAMYLKEQTATTEQKIKEMAKYFETELGIKEAIPKELEPAAQEAKKALSDIEDLYNKKLKEGKVGDIIQREDMGRKLARIADKYIKELPKDTQEFLATQSVRDLETGEMVYGYDRISGGIIKQLDDFIEGLPVKEVKPLPEIEKPPIKKEVKLYAGLPDPGVDKFIVEELRPTLNKAMEAGKYLWKIGRYIPEIIMRIIEPAKLVSGKPYSAVIRGIHHPEARLVEFDQKRLTTLDTNISELEKWYNNNFSDADLENLMLSRGNPASANALRIQADAIKSLPKELKLPIQQKVIQEIADFNYKFLQKVAGKDIHKVEDYFYGMYENAQMVDKFLDYWRSTERFIKTKNIPTVADAADYGLKLKHKNPVANLRAEFRAIAKLEGMVWMREELLRTGKGIYIDQITPAPATWDKINDPVFKELRVEPNLARLINNLIKTNQISRIPILNALRKVNNFLRTIKFVGSGFHALVIAKQSLADSGWLGFAYKKTAVRGATFGFKTNDPIFQTKEFKEYVELGGSHKYSIEFQAKRALSDAMDKVYRGNYLGAFTKFGIIPTKIPLGFVNWMFNNYIPKVKYTKYLDFVSAKENKLGRMLTDLEKIEIIKEGQNFYGMMNERLFGRGATATTLLRFVFMAPGYAEGNYRTILKGFSQWGVKGTYGAGRSRFNVVNSLLLTGIMATVGTLILTGKSPDKPEKLEDIRDLFKIDTGKKDDKGRKIMIDLMTYDKDYWNIYFNVLRGRPDIAVTESIKRVGGMKASTFGMLVDFGQMLQGQAIYDWKEDKVFEITDPFLLKVQKLATHEVKRLEPISVSVYKQLREKDVDAVFASIAAMLGIRSTKTEADKRQQVITNRLFSLRDQQEQLYYYLGSIKDPKKAIENYNKTVNDILGAKLVPQSMRDEWESKLLIDIDKLLSNKVYQLTGPMTTLTPAEKEKEIEGIKKYLKNFEVTPEELEKHLKYYWQEHPVKNQWSKTHQQNVLMRKVRLKERY